MGLCVRLWLFGFLRLTQTLIACLHSTALPPFEPEQCSVGLAGTKAFLSPISCRQDSSHYDLPWVPKGRSEQLPTKGGAAEKPPEARLKGPEKLLKVRETTWDPAHMLVLSETPINSWLTVVKPSSSLEWRHMAFWGRSPVCPPLPGKAIKQFFPPSWKTSSPGFDSAPV